tara:strand:- start:424 stop:561 length:138 start_codon:yes stop_codon:yes gene_type:complete
MTLTGKLFTICVTDNLGLEIGDRGGSVAWVTAADTPPCLVLEWTP